MEKVCIIGAGGHGREIYQIIRDVNNIKKKFKFLGFIDDNKDLWHKKIMNQPVIGGLDSINNQIDDDIKYILGLGFPEAKKKILDKLSKYNEKIEFFNIFHPSARITDDCEIGAGVAIFPNCVVSINTKLGDHCCLNSGVNLSHDSSMGRLSIANPYTVINGNCKIGEGVNLGSGSVVIQNISIGDWSIIGAGAVVINDVPPNVTAVGVPAKLIK